MAHQVPNQLWVVAAPTFLWKISSHLQPRIWLMISGRNWIMLLRCCTQMKGASLQRRQASKCSKRHFKGELSDSSYTLKSSEIMLLVSLPIRWKVRLLMTMWHRYTSTITISILSLVALWPMGGVHAAAQLQISHSEDGKHCLHGFSRICIVGGYFSATLRGGQMSDNLQFFGEVFSLFLVFCLFYYHIGHVHAWWAVLGVHDIGIKHWDVCLWVTHCCGIQTPSKGIMWLVVRYLYPAEDSPND